jgi:hypothetical protein
MGTKINTILQNYATPPHPTAYGGINTVSQHYNLQPNKVAKILNYSDAYGLHREYKKPKVRNPFYIRYKRQQIQIDLIDMQKLGTSNRGFNYLLVAIDCFTKYIWVRAVKSKHANIILDAIKSIISTMIEKPKTIFCDKGTEFVNYIVTDYLTRNGILQLHPNNKELKAAIVERVNKSLQTLIYKYMSDNQTKSYVDVLPLIVSIYNTRPHRSIDKLTPEEAEKPENAKRVLSALQKHYDSCRRGNPKIKFKIGDIVRFKTGFKNVFQRGYKQQFTEELYEIININTRMAIPMYQLKSLNNGKIEAKMYYSNELQARPQKIFKIEKILRREIGNDGLPYCLVKWVGFDDIHNSWIPESNITKTYPSNNNV